MLFCSFNKPCPEEIDPINLLVLKSSNLEIMGWNCKTMFDVHQLIHRTLSIMEPHKSTGGSSIGYWGGHTCSRFWYDSVQSQGRLGIVFGKAKTIAPMSLSPSLFREYVYIHIYICIGMYISYHIYIYKTCMCIYIYVFLINIHLL